MEFIEVSKHFHESWHNELKPFIESGKFDKIYNELKNTKDSGKTLMPSKFSVIFRCFRETDLNNLKVIFVGLSPYFIPNVADGLAFSCSNTMKEQPSLKTLFDALENDLGYKDTRNPDLKRWANQGVLLLNASLTSLPNEPRIHLELWKEFMLHIMNVLKNRQLVFVFFGKDAQEYSKYTNENLHKVIKVNHPSYYARNDMPMEHKNLFTTTNNVLKSWDKTSINWQEYRGNIIFNNKEEYAEFI